MSFLQENMEQLMNDINLEKKISEMIMDSVRHMMSYLYLLRDHSPEPLDRQFKEFRYELEDTIDAGLTEITLAETRLPFWSRRREKRRRTKKLAEAVKGLKERKFNPLLLNDRNSTFGGWYDASRRCPQRTNYFNKMCAKILKHSTLCLEDEENSIIGYLMEEREELDVISITGRSGLGKTSLARKVFENQKTAYEFPTRIWINVSKTFNIRNVHLDILKMFTSQDMSSLSDEKLTETTRACLIKEKFLLILDDIWDISHWRVIQGILPKSNGMAKVLITSRSEYLGALVNEKRKAHKMRLLTIEESWELLQLEVFGNFEDCPIEMKMMKKCMSKCDGLPLSVVVIGGILASQLHDRGGSIEFEWRKMFEKVSRKSNISDFVELSYNGLPLELRECFLYMGVFPRDYKIPASTLIHLWIAEGFVQRDNSESLEEIATKYLHYLICRNLVMVDKINPIGEVKTCRVHDIIVAFCIRKAKEQSIFQKIKVPRRGVLEPPVSELQMVRRVCVHSNVKTLLSEAAPLKIPRVRSFLCFDNSPKGSDTIDRLSILQELELLRVLETKSIKFHKIPQMITKLLHLKYITLTVDDLDLLPKDLSQLWNLQTLVVETKSLYVTMEANIWRMKRLRHLETNAAIVLSSKAKGAEGAGKNLQTLNRLSPQSCTKYVSKRARNLKSLGIRGRLSTLFKKKFLEKLAHLEKLKLESDQLFFCGKASQTPLCDLPRDLNFPPILKCLTLSNTFLKWKHMSTLARIRTLEVLKLKDNAFAGIYWNAMDDRFASLRFLLIANTDLVHWEASATSFPNLWNLVLKNCVNLNEIPAALAETLEKLGVEHLGKSAVQSAMKIAELKKKHTPQAPLMELSISPGCYQWPEN